MKKLTLIPLLFIFLFVIIKDGKGQSDDDIHHLNYFGFSLSELTQVDFRFSFERRITPEHGIIFQAGYKPDYKEFTDATQVNFGQEATAWCYHQTARSWYTSLGYRFYFNPNKTIYVSPEAFYKNMSADNIIYSWGYGGTSNYYELRDMATDVYGMNLLIGKKLNIKVDPSMYFGLDVFLGGSLRFKNIHTVRYGQAVSVHYHDSAPNPGPIPISDTPLVTDEQPVQLFLQFGIIFFSSW